MYYHSGAHAGCYWGLWIFSTLYTRWLWHYWCFFFFSFEYNCVYIYLTVQSVLVYCSAYSPSSVHLCCAWTITCYMVVSAGSAFYTGPQVNFLLGSQPGECVIVEEITWTNRWTFLSFFFFFWNANQTLNREQFGSARAVSAVRCEAKVKPFRYPLSPREKQDKNMTRKNASKNV